MTSEPTISVAVDPSNPGQFFACCGLLELADRLWDGAEGWFDQQAGDFRILAESSEASAAGLVRALAACELRNTMALAQVDRRETLSALKKREMSPADEAEKKILDKLWRESAIVLGRPFQIKVDWFLDDQADGSRFKTWAGQQSVIDIATAMKRPVSEGEYDTVEPRDWLMHPCGRAVTFNFDADSSVQSSGLDVGFVLDPLGMGSASRPLLEFLAFVGLQRFRPAADARANAYTYATWTTPLLPTAAAAMATSCVDLPGLRTLTFPLLYRTKYLKSFLPAKPNGDHR